MKISRMWVIGKNQNVLRMTLVSEQGRPLSAIYFGDIEAMRTYLVEQYGTQEVEKAFHGRENNMQILYILQRSIHTKTVKLFSLKYNIIVEKSIVAL